MNMEKLNKLIKKKYHLKYIVLGLTLVLYALLVGIIVTEFYSNNKYNVFFGIFIGWFAIIIVLNIVYEKKYALPNITSQEILHTYLSYFASASISYLEYREAITWFYRLIQSEYNKKKWEPTDFDNKIHLLYRLLQPDNNGTPCYAFDRKDNFTLFAKDMLGSDDEKELNLKIDKFRQTEPEKHRMIEWAIDKNILLYLLLFPIHILGCFLISQNGDQFLRNTFWGNFCLYIPADLIIILLYKGVLKNTENR